MPFEIRDLVIKIEDSEGRRIVAFCEGESCEGFSGCPGQSCQGQSCQGPSGCAEGTCAITACTETRERALEAGIDLEELRTALQQALAKLR